MIEQLDICNVRSFKGEHQIPLRPITLVYGPNSAGKSSIIQSLVLLKQTLVEHGDTGSRPTLRLRGKEVDLGTFSTIIHGHDEKSELSLAIRAADDSDSNRSDTFGVGISFGFDGRSKSVRPRRSTLLAKQFELVFTPVDGVEAEDQYELTDTQALIGLLDAHGDDDEDIQNARERLAQRGPEQALMFYARDRTDGAFPTLPVPGQFAAARTDLRFGAWFTNIALECVESSKDALSNLVYLGPMRVAPTRFQQVLDRDVREVGHLGENTTGLLLDDGVIAKVNAWLAHLDITYKIELEQLTAEGSDLIVTSLIDTRDRRRSRLRVTPQDVGYGVSQLLPVIVQLLAPGTATICVEQPELHIHPRLQARLADLFILASEKGKQVIVETHSEAFMLRLQGRMREGRLSEKDIAVWYVNAANRTTTSFVKQLRQRENGSFVNQWPDGFFAERFDEATKAAFGEIPDV